MNELITLSDNELQEILETETSEEIIEQVKNEIQNRLEFYL